MPAFEIAAYPGDQWRLAAHSSKMAGPPPFWIRRDGEWRLRGVFEELPLPRSWPVYVSHAQAEAYAAWAGMRLPTEAEYHRAAFGVARRRRARLSVG